MFDGGLVEQFYEQLESIIKKFSGKTSSLYTEIPENNGKEQRNNFEWGKRMKEEKDFWNSNKSHKMTLVNNLFPYKISRRATWHSPDCVTRNQIDFILHHGYSSPASTEPRTEYFRERIPTATATWL